VEVNVWVSPTVRVNAWVASGETPFAAVMRIVYVPLVPMAGVPAIVAVPFPLSVNPTPEGNAPLDASAGVGSPVVVTVNVPAWPTENVALLALVITGT
jgi:hypothetical protein